MPQALFQAFIRVGCLRPAVTPVLEEWPSRRSPATGCGHTEPGLQADWQFTPNSPLFWRLLGGFYATHEVVDSWINVDVRGQLILRCELWGLIAC